MSEDIAPLRKVSGKKGLGRGLGSLLGELSEVNKETTTVEASIDSPSVRAHVSSQEDIKKEIVTGKSEVTLGRIWSVPVEKVFPNESQPRKIFEAQALKELASSIKEKGIILPIIVRKKNSNEFEIIAGERRWRAAQQAGLHEVPVIIRETDNKEVLELALIENIQRQDLNPIEEGEAYIALATKYNLTQQQIAEKVGKERATVANLMRLSGLAPEVKRLVSNGELALGQAKVLLGVEDLLDQTKLAKKILQLSLSVRASEKLVQNHNNKAIGHSDLKLESDTNAKQAQPLISEIQSILGTKAEVEFSGVKSKVTLHFYSVPELNQFMDRLRELKK